MRGKLLFLALTRIGQRSAPAEIGAFWPNVGESRGEPVPRAEQTPVTVGRQSTVSAPAPAAASAAAQHWSPAPGSPRSAAAAAPAAGPKQLHWELRHWELPHSDWLRWELLHGALARRELVHRAPVDAEQRPWPSAQAGADRAREPVSQRWKGGQRRFRYPR